MNVISEDDEMVLHNLGIETKGKDLCTVLNSLKIKWNRFSDIERRAVATAIAGVRAISDINAFVDNFQLTTNVDTDE